MIYVFIILLIPMSLVGLVMYLVKNKSTTKSRWKYPPTDRIVQFIFSLTHTLFLGLCIVAGFGSFFTLRNIFEVTMVVFVFAIFIYSAISIFRPKYMVRIGILYLLLFIGSYVETIFKN